jgi:hypothetical protein
MFLLGYNINDNSTEEVNSVSGGRPRPRWRNRRGSGGVPRQKPQHPMHIAVEPLPTPSLVRPPHEPGVLYVRVAAPVHSGGGTPHIAVLPDAGATVAKELAEGLRMGAPVERAVVVGADAFLDPRAGEAALVGIEALCAVVDALVAARVPFVWRTRGGIDGPLPPLLSHALQQAHGFCVVEIGVPTLDDELAAALEGHGILGRHGTAAADRLRLASALHTRGVVVRGLVDPLVPMLTDQQNALEALVEAFAQAGVARLGARYIVLTPERARAVTARLAGMQRALIQGVFTDEPWHKPDPAAPVTGSAGEVHKKIPGHLRRAGHHRLLEAGARHGVHVDVLDPVREGEDLSAEGAPVEKVEKAPTKRRRPQLELFRKSK